MKLTCTRVTRVPIAKWQKSSSQISNNISFYLKSTFSSATWNILSQGFLHPTKLESIITSTSKSIQI